MITIKQIDKEKYYSDDKSRTLFENENSFSFGKIEIDNVFLKFGWNSKGINPELKFFKDTSIFLIGVDTYIIGYNYHTHAIALFLTTSTNFKWFDELDQGVAVVLETSIILLNITTHCTLRNCFFFGDIIMDTQIDNKKIKVSFLNNDDEILST